jgi:hypothetical protein
MISSTSSSLGRICILDLRLELISRLSNSRAGHRLFRSLAARKLQTILQAASIISQPAADMPLVYHADKGILRP